MVCSIGIGVVWSQRATSAPSKQTPKSPFPTRELKELDRVVQARFAVIPMDGSFGFSRITPPGGMHGTFYPASKPEVAVVDGLKTTRQQVAFYLVGRKEFAGRFMGMNRVYGPVILPSVAVRPWKTKAEYQTAKAEYESVSASAPQNSKLCEVADAVFAQAKPGDGTQTQVKEWHIIARPIEASSMECVTCHNNMATRAAESAKPPIEKPDLVSLHDPLGIALYCVRTAPKEVKQQQQKSPS